MKARVWELPEVPDDVLVVKDKNGQVWKRKDEYEYDFYMKDRDYVSAQWGELLEDYGPLEEVPRPDVDAVKNILSSRATIETEANRVVELFANYYGEEDD